MSLNRPASTLSNFLIVSSLLGVCHAQIPSCTVTSEPVAVSQGTSELLGDVVFQCHSFLPSQFELVFQTRVIGLGDVEIVNHDSASITVGSSVIRGSSVGVGYVVKFFATEVNGTEIRLSGVRVNSSTLPNGSTISATLEIVSGLNVIPLVSPQVEVAKVLSEVLIDTPSLPVGSQGQPYQQNLVALGGAQPYSNWTVIAGSLPPGLTLNASTGQITGTPTSVGIFNLSVTVQDADGIVSQPVDYYLNISSSSVIPQCFTYGLNLAIFSGPTQTLGTLFIGCESVLPATGSVLVEFNTGENSSIPVSIIYPEFTRMDAGVIRKGTVVHSNAVSYSLNGASGTQIIIDGLVVDGTTYPTSTNIFATVKLLDSSGVPIYQSDPSMVGTVLPHTEFSISTSSSLPAGVVGAPYDPLVLTLSDPSLTKNRTDIVAGKLPSGMMIDPDTGDIMGTPSETGEFKFIINIHSFGLFIPAKLFTLTVDGPVSITTNALPSGAVGNSYNAALSAMGGATPYSNWSIRSGALPPGLNIDPATGIVTGIPTIPGTFSFGVSVNDNTANQATPVLLSITIGSSPVIVTSAVPSAKINQPYLATLSATGGNQPYTLWIVASGTLPTGLTLSVNGMISGTPTVAGTFPLNVSVRDSAGHFSVPRSITLIVQSQQLLITTPSVLPTVERGDRVNFPFSASGGVAPYRWALTSGALPTGLILDPLTGIVTGKLEKSGDYQFTLSVRDHHSTVAAQAFSVRVTGAKIITPPVLPKGEISISYLLKLIASLGNFRWSLVSGSLPPGLTLFSNGVISGKPLFSGTTTFSVQAIEEILEGDGASGLKSVNEAKPESITQTFTITIPEAVSITSTSLRNGTVAASYSQTLDARGGSGSLTWTLNDGALPTGMTLSPSGELAGAPRNTGTFNFGVRATDSAGLFDSKSFHLNISSEFNRAGVLSHIAAGGGWKTGITLSNPSDFPVDVKINFRGNDGKPLALSFINAGVATALVERTIQPLSSLQLETSEGSTQVLVGSAEILSSGVLTGYAIFRQQTPTGFSEGTVPLERNPGQLFVLPFDNSNGFGTGVGLTTLTQSGTSQITAILRDENGNHLGSHSLVFSANGHQSFTLADQFSATVGKRGVVEFRSSAGSVISGIGLRFAPDATFTSLPVARPMPSGVFSQVASGGSWKTTLSVHNPHSTPVDAKVSFHAHDGNSWALPLKVISGEGVENLLSGVVEKTIAPRSTLIIESEDPKSSTAAGWASVNASSPVTGYTIFRQQNEDGRNSEGTSVLEDPTQPRFVLSFDNSSSLVTGIALVSPIEGKAAAIRATLWDDKGVQIASKSIGLNAKGHTSFTLPDQFPGSVGKKGYILFEAPVDLGVTGLGLRFSPEGTFTSIPSAQK